MSSNAPSLTRTLGLWQVTISGVGIVIGAGIYVLIGDATALAGSLVWASFVIAALLAAFTGLSYAELAGLFPSAGAESEFARRAFNEFWGFLAGWLMVIGNVVGAGAVALGFARYLQQFVAIDMRVGAIGLLVVLTMIVAGGIRRSIWFSTALVLLQVGGLLMVIWVGLPHIGTRDLTDGTTTGVLSAAALVFFAFIGFDEVVTLSDETRDAHRTIPRALLLALGISTALYLAVGVAAVSVIDWHDLAASDRPLGLVLSHVTGSYGSDILAAIALASTTNTTLLLLTAASRLLFNMSQRGRLPAALSTVGARTKAPQVAAIVACVGAIPLALTQQLGLVASITDFTVYAVFIAVNLAVLRLRVSHPELARPIHAGPDIAGWPIAPIIGLAVTAVMLVFLDRSVWLVGGALLGAGIGAWFWFGDAAAEPA